MARHPPSVLGSVSESFADALLDYVAKNPDALLANTQALIGGEGEEPEGEWLTGLYVFWIRSHGEQCPFVRG